MEVRFVNEKMKRYFSDQRELGRRWGTVGATKISLRLQQLAAAPTLADMRTLPGRCRALVGERTGCFAVDLQQPYRLIFQPTAVQADTDGGLDWATVDSVTALDVVGYH